MNRNKFNIQRFAEFNDILTEHADAFAGDDQIATTFGGITGKLKELGYDVYLNKRDAAEFVPAHRLNEVVSQREQYRVQVEAANAELAKLKGSTGLTDEERAQVQGLMDDNNKLLEELSAAKIQLEVLAFASDAIDPKDILGFINKDKIKLDKNKNIISGAKEEVERIRLEKPYLFKKGGQDASSKGGIDNSDQLNKEKVGMNQAIRKAAFGGVRSF